MRNDRRTKEGAESEERVYKVRPSKLASDGSKRRWQRFVERVKEKDVAAGGIQVLSVLKPVEEKKFEPSKKNELRMAVIESKDGKYAVAIVADNGNALSVNYDMTDRVQAEGEARANAALLEIGFMGFLKQPDEPAPSVPEPAVPVPPRVPPEDTNTAKRLMRLSGDVD